jgi:hypothetical protein
MGELPLPSDPGGVAESSSVHWIMDHPKLWGIVTLVAIAPTFSPKVSAGGVWVCLIFAELTTIGLAFSIARKRQESRFWWSTWLGLIGLIGFIFYGSWLVGGKVPDGNVASAVLHSDTLSHKDESSQKHFPALQVLGNPTIHFNGGGAIGGTELKGDGHYTFNGTILAADNKQAEFVAYTQWKKSLYEHAGSVESVKNDFEVLRKALTGIWAMADPSAQKQVFDSLDAEEKKCLEIAEDKEKFRKHVAAITFVPVQTQ